MKLHRSLMFALILIFVLACGITGTNTPVTVPPASEATNQAQAPFTPIPTFTPEVQSTPILSPLLTMQSTPLSETGATPPYTFKAQIPYLQGSSDPRVTQFNEYMSQLVLSEIESYRNDMLAFASNPPIANGSSFDLTYTVIGQRVDIWSIKLEIYFYTDGAAHPGHYSVTVNYDLQNGRELTLDELFLSGSNYLQVISDESKSQLAARDIGFDMFATGADPLPENYLRWNLSSEGLVITFDEYQVAPYAAGPQVVVIPFYVLQSVINPQSAIVLFY